MSLIHEVTRLVGKLGEATGDDLVPYLHGYTRKQIFAALQNAAHNGKIECVRRQPRTDKFAGPGVYVVTERAPVAPRLSIPRVNSVFALGAMA